MDKDKLVADADKSSSLGSISDLQVAFDLLKKRVRAPLTDDIPGRDFILSHNRELYQKITSLEGHFRDLAYIYCPKQWLEILQLVAGGYEVGPELTTSAILLQGGRSSGKTASAITLTNYLMNGSARPEDLYPSHWPISCPLLLTASELTGKTILQKMATILGYQEDFFSTPEALVQWVELALNKFGDKLQTFTLILDNPWALDDTPNWALFADLIRAAGHSSRFKIVSFCTEYPLDLTKDIGQFLFHSAIRNNGFEQLQKPAFLPLEGFYPNGFEAQFNLLNSNGHLGPISNYWQYFNDHWALAFFSWAAKKLPAFTAKLNIGRVAILLDLANLLDKHFPKETGALVKLLQSLGRQVLAPFSPTPELQEACNLLHEWGLLLRDGSSYRFISYQVAAFYLARITPGIRELDTWYVNLYICNSHPDKNYHVLFKQRVLDNDPSLRAAIVALEDDFHYTNAPAISADRALLLISATIGMNHPAEVARFFFHLGLDLLAAHLNEAACHVLWSLLSMIQEPEKPTAADIDTLRYYYESACQLLAIHNASGGADHEDEERVNRLRQILIEWYNLPEEIKTHPTLQNTNLLVPISQSFIQMRITGTAAMARNKLGEFLTAAIANAPTSPLVPQALVSAATIAEQGGLMDKAIELWQDLHDRLLSVGKHSPLFVWSELALWRIKYNHDSQEGLKLVAYGEDLKFCLQQNCPLNTDLLSVISEYLNCLNLLNPLADNMPHIQRGLSDLTGDFLQDYVHPSNLILDNALALWLKNHHLENLAHIFFTNAVSLYFRHTYAVNKGALHLKNHSVFMYNLGYLLNRQGYLAQAGVLYNMALEMRYKLLTMEPRSHEYQHDLILCHNVLGVLCYNCDHAEKASRHFKIAEEKITALQDILLPANLLREMCVVYQNHAMVEQNCGHLTAAADCFMHALELLCRHHESIKKNAEIIHRVVLTINICSAKLHNQGHTRDGMTILKVAIEAEKRLSDIDKNNFTFPSTVGVMECAYAGLTRNLGNLEAATALEEKAFANIKQAIADHPHETALRLALANMYLTCSRTTVHAAGKRSPQELANKAQQILNGLLLENPHDEQILQAITDCMSISHSYNNKVDG